ncbi:hypothetical protein BDQ12DRAFT_615190 [Crucibulum laeve]|uniref:Carboxylesterase type B domain-containing protein n=1 Tax=Crucibulum laeve TaxID=68775 RepID=A0A5C3LL35_9AGAR|nr:hypothetical protein BDQ12DRAFT_615190 [Crucibulum laeve]
MWLSVLISLALSILFVNQNRLLTFIEYRDNTVDLGYARYRGNRTFPSTVAYLGIPYAEPPLGELRFRAPIPLNLTRVSELSNGVLLHINELSQTRKQ